MFDYIDYEAMVFALGGDTECPACGIGLLIPDNTENPSFLSCDICDEEFECSQNGLEQD